MMIFFALQVLQLPLNINYLLGDIQPDRGHGHDVINALLQNPALCKTRVKHTRQRTLKLAGELTDPELHDRGQGIHCEEVQHAGLGSGVGPVLRLVVEEIVFVIDRSLTPTILEWGPVRSSSVPCM